MANYDIIGDIAIVKFNDGVKKEEKIEKAKGLMKNPSIKTVLEKANKVSGRLRTIKTRFLLGENKKETLYKESGCSFKLNVETCYFSPRLASERLEIAKLIAKKKKSEVIVMFSGVGPFSIVIAKHSKPSRIISIELGKDCNKYAKQNVILNKVENIVNVVNGDVKKIIPRINKKFDFVVMPRPNLKETFLKQGLAVSKKGTKIIYYGFSSEKGLEKMLSDLHDEAKKVKRKIKIINIKEAGDIAPYGHRYRLEIEVI